MVAVSTDLASVTQVFRHHHVLVTVVNGVFIWMTFDRQMQNQTDICICVYVPELVSWLI